MEAKVHPGKPDHLSDTTWREITQGIPMDRKVVHLSGKITSSAVTLHSQEFDCTSQGRRTPEALKSMVELLSEKMPGATIAIVISFPNNEQQEKPTE